MYFVHAKEPYTKVQIISGSGVSITSLYRNIQCFFATCRLFFILFFWSPSWLQLIEGVPGFCDCLHFKRHGCHEVVLVKALHSEFIRTRAKAFSKMSNKCRHYKSYIWPVSFHWRFLYTTLTIPHRLLLHVNPSDYLNTVRYLRHWMPRHAEIPVEQPINQIIYFLWFTVVYLETKMTFISIFHLGFHMTRWEWRFCVLPISGD